MLTRVAVEFQGERVDLDVPEGRVVAAWQGPAGAPPGDVPAILAEALERPLEYPALRQAVVPVDRVVIALGADVPEAPAVLAAACRVLESAGVQRDAITVLTDPNAAAKLAGLAPPGLVFLGHDPENRTDLAYLAATTPGRRVYLNRALTDADFVLPIGRLAYDPVLGYQGPWGVLFPGLSDSETRRSLNADATDDPPDPLQPRPALVESAEVSYLLGSQFQIGLVAGVSGLAGAYAGLGSAVLEQGVRGLDAAWEARFESRAELVIAGVGRPGEPSGIDAVARGLATATRLVQRGGKVVVLSRAEGPLGPAVRTLLGADDPRAAAAALRGHEADPDYPTARSLAKALAWADVYLLSALEPDDVEGLSMIPLDRPGEAGRLAATSGSCLVVSHADLARGSVADEPE